MYVCITYYGMVPHPIQYNTIVSINCNFLARSNTISSVPAFVQILRQYLDIADAHSLFGLPGIRETVIISVKIRYAVYFFMVFILQERGDVTSILLLLISPFRFNAHETIP